jgi:5-methylcytosine-specific restriction enzyme subunit McrC
LKETLYIKEYGTITIGQKNLSTNNNSYLEVHEEIFDSITNFIEENQSQEDFDKAFSIYRKKGQRFIKVKNYVGVIETKEKVTIEILPKTFIGKNGEEANVEESRNLLLTMLKTLKNSPFINLNVAHLKEQKNFPILEVFIGSYLDELIKLTSKELRGDYVKVEVNCKFLKGKLLLNEHIKLNSFNKTNFYCQFDEFNTNIPPNKLIKSTLLKLNNITTSNKNKKKILKSIQHFESVNKCSNIDSDIAYCRTREKALVNYGNLINWSEIFLKNKSFTNFSGNSINQAILFPMEKLFESYIAHLLKKYCGGYSIRTQDRKFFLVGQKRNHDDLDYTLNKFLLKPDVVIDEFKLIMDTKWKILNSESRKYDIKEADIYQMHAYGSRYSSGHLMKSRLALIYPKNPNFQEKLLQFRYGEDMYLDVLPFDFSNKSPESEIKKIVNEFFATTMYVERPDDKVWGYAADD